jgi:nitroreductase
MMKIGEKIKTFLDYIKAIYRVIQKERVRRSYRKMADKNSLRTQILMNTHFLDRATQMAKEGSLSLKSTKATEKLLEEWQKRGYHETPYIFWSREVIKRYKDFVEMGVRPNVSDSIEPSNNLWKVVEGRRSIRRWQKKDIDLDTIKKILNAAIWAPTSCNRHALRYIVITNSELKDFIATIAKAGPYQSYISETSVLILVVVDPRFYNPKEVCFQGLDAGAAIENMILAASSLGIGSCWIGFINMLSNKNEIRLREEIKIADHEDICSLVVFGYSDGVPYPPARPPLEEVTTFFL